MRKDAVKMKGNCLIETHKICYPPTWTTHEEHLMKEAVKMACDVCV